MREDDDSLGISTRVAREYLRVSRDATGAESHRTSSMPRTSRPCDVTAGSCIPTYRDDDISASRYSKKLRAGFDRLIADLESGSFDAGLLVLWESSRGSRRVDEWVRLIGLCEQHAVVIFVTTHGREYDPTTARDRKSLLEDAVDSEYESAKTSARIRRSVKAAAEQGRPPHGKNLYGYRRVYDETTRRLLRIEPHPEQAPPVVQEAARRFLAGGETFYAIAKNFNERGIPPPRRPSHTERRRHYGWTPPAVKEMIGKPAYAGKRQFRGGEVVSDALWPPLIDPEVWETKLLPQLNSESRRRTNDWPARHLLAGIAVCGGVCGAGARVGKQNQGRPQFATDGTALPRKHYNTYVCSGVPGRTGFHVAMKKDHLDEVVTEFLLQRLQRPRLPGHHGPGGSRGGCRAPRPARGDRGAPVVPRQSAGTGRRTQADGHPVRPGGPDPAP